MPSRTGASGRRGPGCIGIDAPSPGSHAQEQLEKQADPSNKEQQALLEEMRAHLKKLQVRAQPVPCWGAAGRDRSLLVMAGTHTTMPRRQLKQHHGPQDLRRNEDPRLSFSTPEFKEAQRAFTDGFKVRRRLPLLVVAALTAGAHAAPNQQAGRRCSQACLQPRW